ncbi:MAG: DUF222 domain-containing protein, partial [Pseudoclavibacter sp.]
FSIGGERDGLVHVRGNVLPEVAAQLQTLLDAYLNPKRKGPIFAPLPPAAVPTGEAPAAESPTSEATNGGADNSHAPGGSTTGGDREHTGLGSDESRRGPGMGVDGRGVGPSKVAPGTTGEPPATGAPSVNGEPPANGEKCVAGEQRATGVWRPRIADRPWGQPPMPEGSTADGAGDGVGTSGATEVVGPTDDEVPWGFVGPDPLHPDLMRVDKRTRPQEQHDALAGILEITARHPGLPTIGGAAPTLTVSVRAEDLAENRGWATVERSGEPVSLAVARHVACTGAVHRVTIDANGRVIRLDTTDRVFNAHQRRAIQHRDGGCIIPGCTVPAAWCEIHHVHEHARGGATHTDNGVTLCWHHHRTIDTSGWRIRMRDGTPEVQAPHQWDATEKWRPAGNKPRHPRQHAG